MSSISELLNNHFSLFNLFPMINVCINAKKNALAIIQLVMCRF